MASNQNSDKHESFEHRKRLHARRVGTAPEFYNQGPRPKRNSRRALSAHVRLPSTGNSSHGLNEININQETVPINSRSSSSGSRSNNNSIDSNIENPRPGGVSPIPRRHHSRKRFGSDASQYSHESLDFTTLSNSKFYPRRPSSQLDHSINSVKSTPTNAILEPLRVNDSASSIDLRRSRSYKEEKFESSSKSKLKSRKKNLSSSSLGFLPSVSNPADALYHSLSVSNSPQIRHKRKSLNAQHSLASSEPSDPFNKTRPRRATSVASVRSSTSSNNSDLKSSVSKMKRLSKSKLHRSSSLSGASRSGKSFEDSFSAADSRLDAPAPRQAQLHSKSNSSSRLDLDLELELPSSEGKFSEVNDNLQESSVLDQLIIESSFEEEAKESKESPDELAIHTSLSSASGNHSNPAKNGTNSKSREAEADTKSKRRPSYQKKRPNSFSLDLAVAVGDEGDSNSNSNISTTVEPVTKSKKRLNRRATMSNVEGLQINMKGLMNDEEDALEATFEFTSSGCFNIAGFEIQESGITRTPESGKELAPENTKQQMVKLNMLGRGASGVVFKMLHVPTFKLVAVKAIPCFEQEKRHQLLKELQALYKNLVPIKNINTSADSHSALPACPYIVTFHDAFINPNEGNISIVVEYMDGGSLQDLVDSPEGSKGISNETVLANIAIRVLKGLKFIHSFNKIHRDIKPSNLLIDHDGNVKISDFGITRELTDPESMANTFVGTLTYMSPERIAGEDYSFKSDIWSFGLTMMTIAEGKFPIATTGGYWGLLQVLRNEPPPSISKSSNFSNAFIDFINLCLVKDPTQRASASELLKHDFFRETLEVNLGTSSVLHDEHDGRTHQYESKRSGHEERPEQRRRRRGLRSLEVSCDLDEVESKYETSMQFKELATIDIPLISDKCSQTALKEIDDIVQRTIEFKVQSVLNANFDKEQLITFEYSMLDSVSLKDRSRDSKPARHTLRLKRVDATCYDRLAAQLNIDAAPVRAKFKEAITLANEWLSRRPTGQGQAQGHTSMQPKRNKSSRMKRRNTTVV